MNEREDLHPDPVDPALAETVSDFEYQTRLDRAETDPEMYDESLFEDDEIDASDQLIEGFDPEAHIHNTRVYRKKYRKQVRKQLLSQGAHFIYGLLILTGTLGIISLAVTIQSVELITISMIISPIVIAYAVISWKRWLRGAPYVYRLLTSLGEDAENLAHWRLPFFRF